VVQSDPDPLTAFGIIDRSNCHSEQSEESFSMRDNELAIQSETITRAGILLTWGNHSDYYRRILAVKAEEF
jgi:hypothetical protein